MISETFPSAIAKLAEGRDSRRQLQQSVIKYFLFRSVTSILMNFFLAVMAFTQRITTMGIFLYCTMSLAHVRIDIYFHVLGLQAASEILKHLTF